MTQMTMEDVGKLAIAAWGNDAPKDDTTGAQSDVIVNAVAIAWAESGGVTTKHNPIWPDDSWGLWQINMRGQMGADRRKQLGLSSNEELLDPTTNARAAHQVWADNGHSFKPWTTYTDGTYTSFVPAARRAVGNELGSPPTSDISDVLPNIANAVAGIAQAFWKTMVWASDPHNWVRLLVVGLGGSLIIGGLVVLAKPNTGVVTAVQAAPRAALRSVKGGAA